MSTSVQTLASTGFVPQWTIGDRLRKAREMTGLTQVQFAERVGLSRATVNNSELNKSQPRKSVVLLWAMETGVDRDWLMTGSANNETPDPDGPGGELLRLDSNQQPSGYRLGHNVTFLFPSRPSWDNTDDFPSAA